MSSLQASTLLINPSRFCSSNSKYSSSSLNRINCAFNVPKPPRASLSIPKASTRNLVDHGLDKYTNTTLEMNDRYDTIKILHHDDDDDVYNSTPYSKATIQLYAILEAIADRIEMHNNMKEQRDNWNTLLLNSINMMTLTATTMAGIATSTAPVPALKLSSALLFSAATGLLLVMNKIQPSQLAEEQRNATRLFKQLHNQIETTIALGNNNNPSEGDVRVAMEKVLELDKAYPLPLLGAMLEKFPSKFKAARWWPNKNEKPQQDKEVVKMIDQDKGNNKKNGWNVELEREMREVVEVVKGKDMEDYERLGNLALKINKGLAITGPMLTGIAALGSVALLGDNGGGGTSWVPVVAGALGAVVNAFEHGGQVGMVFEMYRNCGGFFKLLEETIEETIEERRENGEVFELKVALKLGRSVSQLKQLASKSASYRMEGTELDEFASKLF